MPAGVTAAPTAAGRSLAGIDRGLLVAVVIGSLGNVLEFLDFSVFGFLAPELGQLFFPSDDPVSSSMAALAAFAGSFVVRPLGGAFFGWIGDTRGRKTAVVGAISAMGLSSLILGLLPTYETAGTIASVALVVVRLFQGLSVGGQMVGSFVLLVELAPKGQRGLFGAICSSGANIGTCLGSAVSATLRASMTQQQLLAWGWRIPFVFGVAVAGLTLAVRDRVPESAVFEQLQRRRQLAQQLAPSMTTGTAIEPRAARRQSVCAALRDAPWHVACVTGVCTLWCGGIYIFNTWSPTYEASLTLPELRQPQAFALNSALIVFLVVLMCWWGKLSDAPTRSYSGVMMAGAAGVAVSATPLYGWLLGAGSLWSFALAQALLCVSLGAFGGPLGAFMVGVCPAESRSTVVGMGYNLAMSAFGGTSPLVCTALMAALGGDPSAMLPGAYMALLAVISGVTLWLSRRYHLDAAYSAGGGAGSSRRAGGRGVSAAQDDVDGGEAAVALTATRRGHVDDARSDEEPHSSGAGYVARGDNGGNGFARL